MIRNVIKSLLLSTAIFISFTQSPVLAGWEDEDIPPPQPKQRELSLEETTAKEDFLDTLFCIYKARKQEVFLIQGMIPKKSSDYKENVEAACQRGVPEARRFKYLELLGRVTTSYNTKLMDFPCIYGKNKSKAAKLIEEWALQGDPYAAKYYIKGMLEGKYGFVKLEDTKRLSFIRKFSEAGYSTAKTYFLKAMIKGEFGEEFPKEKVWTQVRKWADAGDSQMRILYLRIVLLGVDVPLEGNLPTFLVFDDHYKQDALGCLQKWTNEDTYVKNHFNLEFELCKKKQEDDELKQWLEIFERAKEKLPLDQQDRLTAENLKALLSSKQGKPWLLMLAASAAEQDKEAYLEQIEKQKLEQDYKMALPFAAQGVKAARKLVLAYLLSEKPEEAVTLLWQWIEEGDHWAKKAFVQQALNQAENTEGGADVFLKALCGRLTEADEQNIHTHDYNLNIVRDWMKLWKVIPGQMKRKHKEGHLGCVIL